MTGNKIDYMSFMEGAKKITDFYHPVINDSKLYKNECEIICEIDDLNITVNARVNHLAINQYKIIIYRGMIDKLIEQSIRVAQEAHQLFNVPNNKIENLQRNLYEIWINFIICHEWGHIICGHLTYKNRDYWIEEENEVNNIDKDLSYTMELEADTWASRLCLGYFAENKDRISLNLYDVRESENLWSFYFNSIFFLFETLSVDKHNESHPPIIFRVLSSLKLLVREINEKAELKAMLPRAFEDLKDIAIKSLLLCMQNYKIISPIKIQQEVEIAEQYIDTQPFLTAEEHCLSQYRMTKIPF